MNQEAFGTFIRTLRKEKNLTQKELGSRLHLTDKAISKWERGQTLPDITMIEKIAEELGVTTLELMQGKRIEEQTIAKEEVENVLHETMQQANIQTRRVEKHTKWKMLCVFLCVVGLLWAGREVANLLLDMWAEIVETDAHRCEIVPVYGESTGEAYYIYRKQVKGNSYLWNYHVACVDEQGNSTDILLLQERGMDLNRAPKLIQSEGALYILFDGLDNEDLTERLYGGVVGADPQGFLPRLYRYDLKTKELKEIEIKKDTTTMLTDAFSYQGEDVYMAQRFKGVFGGLHLGFYMGGKTYMSHGKSYENLFGDGGLKSTGCVTEDSYYVLAQKGIYAVNLSDKKGKYIITKDFSKCYRSEVKLLELGEEKVFAVAASYVKECDRFGHPKTMTTEVVLYNQSWEEIGKITAPVSTSQIEWGKEGAVISGREDGGYVSYLIDCKEQKAEKITEIGVKPIQNAYHLDELEISPSQWVYVPSVGKYYYVNDEATYALIEER